MKISHEQLNEEVNEELLPYLTELSLPLPIIMKCIHAYITERVNDYEWEDSERAMGVVRNEIDDYFRPPTFEEKFGPLCLN